ncbi:MAG: hypothetical protein J6U19_06520 [Oscillospiraceae bacterium]|nr:hypothetical protein [Oscillospiraceae bacterium]
MYYNNKRLALSIFWAVAGLVLVALSIAGVLQDSVYAGMGGALTAVGALQVIRNLKYRKDPEYREKVDVELNDERSKYLRMKSWAWTGYIVVLVQAVGVIVAMILGKETVQMVLAYSVCLILLVYLITYLVLNKKY